MSLITILQENPEGKGNTKKRVLPHHKGIQIWRMHATVVKYPETMPLSILSEGHADGGCGRKSKGKHQPYQWQQIMVVDVISEPR